MFRHALVVVLVCTGGLFAAEPQGNSDQIKPSPDLKAVLDRLDQMEKTIKGLDAQQSLQVQLWADKFQRDVNEVREWLNRIQKDINELKSAKQVTTETLKPVEANATLQLVNGHQWMNMDVIVNGVTHTVPPMQTRSVTVPPGSVNFQVVQTDGFVRARHLAAGAIHQVTMR